MTDEAVCTPNQIDPRGPRFGGAVTTVVLALSLVFVGTFVGTVLVAWQTLVFALGALVGLHVQPYGVFFRKVIRPRLAPPAEMEDAAPPRFAQLVGLIFMVVALVGIILGRAEVSWGVPLAMVAIAMALIAAFLNAAFNFCLGCEMYLLGKRIAAR